MVSTKGSNIIEFIKHNVISRFGIPMQIILDKSMNFKNKDMQSLCYIYKIKHNFSIPYYLQGNGKAEATNKIIVVILKKTINISHKD